MITRVSGVAFDRARQDHAAIEEFWSDFVDQVAFVDYNPWENAYDNDPNGVEEACSDLWHRPCLVGRADESVRCGLSILPQPRKH